MQLIVGLNLDRPDLVGNKGETIHAQVDLSNVDLSKLQADKNNDLSLEEKFELRKQIMKHIVSDSKYAVKHLLINKTGVKSGHRLSCDTSPSYFTLPCVPLGEAKECTPGQEYEALAICSSDWVYQEVVGASLFSSRRVVSEAQPGDLRFAHEVLTATVKALGENATSEDCVRPEHLIDSADNEADMKDLLKHLNNGKVHVPGQSMNRSRVLKVKLKNSLDCEVPNPMLLAVKAAINWHHIMFCLKLLPACEPPEDPF